MRTAWRPRDTSFPSAARYSSPTDSTTFRVPAAHSRDYRDAAIRDGDSVELREYQGLPHGEQINPAAEHWADAVEWLTSQPI